MPKRRVARPGRGRKRSADPRHHKSRIDIPSALHVTRRFRWGALSIIALVAAPVYLNTLNNDLVYDDRLIVVQNERVILFILLFISAGWLSWKARRRHPVVGFCVLGYAILFGATANIVIPIGTIMGKRLMYAPSAMLCLLVGYGAWLLQRSLNHNAAYLAPATVGIVFIFLTISRNTTWKDELTLYETQVQTAPNSGKAHYNLGAALAKRGDGAVASYRTSLRLFPYYPEPLFNMGKGPYPQTYTRPRLRCWQGHSRRSAIQIVRLFFSNKPTLLVFQKICSLSSLAVTM